jgi:hypothetical protein
MSKSSSKPASQDLTIGDEVLMQTALFGSAAGHHLRISMQRHAPHPRPSDRWGGIDFASV